MKTCPFCAEEIQGPAIVCKHCGRGLVAVATTPSRLSPSPRRSGRRWVIGLVLFISSVLAWNIVTSPEFAAGYNRERGNSLTAKGTPTQWLQVAIHGSGEPCTEVMKAFLQGTDATGVDFWNATCANGRSYAVSVQNDGTTRVLDCAVMQRLTQVECFTPLQ